MVRLVLLLACTIASSRALAPAPSMVQKSAWSNDCSMPTTPTPALPVAAGGAPFGMTRRANGGSIRRDNRNFLMMVRGGGDDEDSVDESDTESDVDEYDASDDETDAEEDVSSDEDGDEITDEGDEPVQPSPADIERAQQSVQFSSQSRNFGIATALWGSLFFDSLLNTKKRMDLFPTNLTSKLIPTAMLASGFGMAAGTAFLLWRDMEIRSDMLSSDDGESRKGDWFLSLAAGSDDGSASAKFASNARARLCLHLSLFGLLNLGAHAGLYFSEGAPFLGMSAAIINVHNTLACVSALRNEEGVMEWMRQALTWPLRALRSDEKGGRLRVTTVLYGLSTASAWVGCILVGRSVLTSATGLLSGMAGAAETATLDNARQLSLQVASLARLTLEAGVSGTLYSASVAGHNKYLGHPFVVVLSGLLVSSCLAVGGSVLFDSFRLAGPVLNNIVGTVLVAFGALAGYHSVVALLAGRKKGAA